jgi:hypothetical protein
VTITLAQALVEKGALDGVAAGIASFFNQTTATVQEKPYLLIILAVVLFLLLKPKRR